MARVIERNGTIFVDVAGRAYPLSADDVRQLCDRATAMADRDHELAGAIDAARRHADELQRDPAVVSVRGGYKFEHGWITSVPAVVIAIRADVRVDALELPTELDGVVTDVTFADPIDLMPSTDTGNEIDGPYAPIPTTLIEQMQDQLLREATYEAVPIITYQPPAGGKLDPITGDMAITCHVSPDAGWAVLRPFLEGARTAVHLGMYDFTAPHIYRSVRSLLRDGDVTWRQTLGPKESLPGPDDPDSTKAGDLKEAAVVTGLERVAPDRFSNEFAHVGAGQTFASAYHIKVAVRDDESVWLSSGNWQSSNQPAIDFTDPEADHKLLATYNREWHLLVDNVELAHTMRTYLEHDFETAAETPEVGDEAAAIDYADVLVPVTEALEEERAANSIQVFPPQRFEFTAANPITVQPILTPDNYLDIVLPLLRKQPDKTLYFQNQSLNPVISPTPEWKELLDLLAHYSHEDDLDVRIIIRDIGPVRKKLESLQAAGFNMARVRLQRACHTKGIVIDGRTVLVGSHNWTNQGVQANRDASLLIHDPEIAAYFQRIFLHDWDKLARAKVVDTGSRLVPAGDEAIQVSPGFRRLSWAEWSAEEW